MLIQKLQRPPWPKDFPPVEIVAETSVVQGHPDYTAAKRGDIGAALRLVESLLTNLHIHWLCERYARFDLWFAAVHAVEGFGVNAIPQVLSAYLSKRTGFPSDERITQINRVSHTKSSGWHRLAHPALFSGEVVKGQNYLLLDDFIGQGGTMANLRTWIEINGGCVVGAIALTGKAYSSILALTPETLNALRVKHGNLELWWRECFGFSFDGLTESEARYILRAEDADTIRNRLAAAE